MSNETDVIGVGQMKLFFLDSEYLRLIFHVGRNGAVVSCKMRELERVKYMLLLTYFIN